MRWGYKDYVCTGLDPDAKCRRFRPAKAMPPSGKRAVVTRLENKKARRSELFCFMWLGYEDSNLGMLVSETRALPLGDTPTVYCYFLLPDMTPTGAFITMNVFLNWLGYEDSNLGMLVSETRALPLGDTPTIFAEITG